MFVVMLVPQTVSLLFKDSHSDVEIQFSFWLVNSSPLTWIPMTLYHILIFQVSSPRRLCLCVPTCSRRYQGHGGSSLCCPGVHFHQVPSVFLR